MQKVLFIFEGDRMAYPAPAYSAPFPPPGGEAVFPLEQEQAEWKTIMGRAVNHFAKNLEKVLHFLLTSKCKCDIILP
jgi:hypothetical protein